ncbi:MAG: glycine cleavage system protein GcvH [Ignavibacteriae bacterium]|jgi:glycine cleavage system H protein|nr:glycine cleavage system protein GcvH [Ignavibacteriota bacterium]
MKIPENLRYTKEHEYVLLEGNTAIVGVTDYAQSELGDIIYIDFTSSAGDVVKAGDIIGSIEAVKTVSEIFSPVSGKIAEVNSDINDKASVVNEDPYGAGWLFKIELSDSSEIDGLLNPTAYSELLGA